MKTSSILNRVDEHLLRVEGLDGWCEHKPKASAASRMATITSLSVVAGTGMTTWALRNPDAVYSAIVNSGVALETVTQTIDLWQFADAVSFGNGMVLGKAAMGFIVANPELGFDVASWALDGGDILSSLGISLAAMAATWVVFDELLGDGQKKKRLESLEKEADGKEALAKLLTQSAPAPAIAKCFGQLSASQVKIRTLN